MVKRLTKIGSMSSKSLIDTRTVVLECRRGVRSPVFPGRASCQVRQKSRRRTLREIRIRLVEMRQDNDASQHSFPTSQNVEDNMKSSSQSSSSLRDHLNGKLDAETFDDPTFPGAAATKASKATPARAPSSVEHGVIQDIVQRSRSI